MSSSETQGQSVGSGEKAGRKFSITGSFDRNWKLSSRLLSRPDWLPLGLRGWIYVKSLKKNRAGKGLFSRGAPELDPNLRFNSFIKAVIPVS